MGAKEAIQESCKELCKDSIGENGDKNIGVYEEALIGKNREEIVEREQEEVADLEGPGGEDADVEREGGEEEAGEQDEEDEGESEIECEHNFAHDKSNDLVNTQYETAMPGFTSAREMICGDRLCKARKPWIGIGIVERIGAFIALLYLWHDLALFFLIIPPCLKERPRERYLLILNIVYLTAEFIATNL
jgi:hypothetical protein